MGTSALLVLAIACSAAFGVAGVLVGLVAGVRSVSRDEERYAQVLKALETFGGSISALKLEWANTLENLEQLAGSVEKGRRRAAASLSAAERIHPEEPVRQLTPREERDEARRRMRGVS